METVPLSSIDAMKWECLGKGRAAGDLLKGSQGGEKSALGRRVGRREGIPGQARGRQLERASCFGRWLEQRRERRGA